MIYSFYSARNDEKPENYEFIGPSIFTANNYLGAGLSMVLPRFFLSTSVNTKHLDSTLRFHINPFGNMFVDNYVKYMPWGIAVNIKGKVDNDFFKEGSLNFRIGNDELMSFYFIDSYIDAAKNKSDLIFDEGGEYFRLTRPFLLNGDISTSVHFESLLKNKVDFIKECSLEGSLKTETLIGVVSFTDKGDIDDLQFKLSDDFKYSYFEFSIKPTLKFNDNVSKHNRNLWIFDNLEVSALSLKFTLKPKFAEIIDFTTNFLKFKKNVFEFSGTLLDFKLKIKNTGLYVGGKVFSPKVSDGKPDWYDFLSLSLTFSLTEFLNNQNR